MYATQSVSARTKACARRSTRSSCPARPSRRVVPVVRAQLPEINVDPVALTYIGLGASAAAFAGTFLVIPQYADQFKEDMAWKDIYLGLKQQGMSSIPPAEALQKAKQGALLLDVRMADRFQDTRTAANSVNAALYQPIQNWDLISNLRRMGFAFFGVYGTERNPNFIEEVREIASPNQEIVVMCDIGGTMQTKVGMDYGFQSRSLKAVYFLQQAGFKKVYHLEGGLSRWLREGLPEDESDEGFSGAAAATSSKSR